MAGGVWLGLWLLAPVLTPFVIAAVLAYALRPAVDRVLRLRVPRWVAVLLVEVLALLLATLLLLLLVPVLVKQAPLLKAQVPLVLDRLNAWLTPLAARFGVALSLDVMTIKGWLTHVFDDGGSASWTSALLSSARIGGSVLMAVVGNAVLVPVVLFFLLMDWPTLTARLLALVPPRLRGAVTGFLDECDAVLGQYMRGQLLVMAALALYYAVALTLTGLDLALPVGVFTGVAVAVPYIGFGLGLAMALLAALLQFGQITGVLLVAAVYGIGQTLESFFLTPRLVGERIGLSPLAVIFALMAFGQLFGFVGVLVALPASAVLSVAVKRLRRWWLGSALFNGHGGAA